jgi:hypothetical protein
MTRFKRTAKILEFGVTNGPRTADTATSRIWRGYLHEALDQSRLNCADIQVQPVSCTAECECVAAVTVPHISRNTHPLAPSLLKFSWLQLDEILRDRRPSLPSCLAHLNLPILARTVTGTMRAATVLPPRFTTLGAAAATHSGTNIFRQSRAAGSSFLKPILFHLQPWSLENSSRSCWLIAFSPSGRSASSSG